MAGVPSESHLPGGVSPLAKLPYDPDRQGRVVGVASVTISPHPLAPHTTPPATITRNPGS